MPISRDFLARPAVEVAPELLGCVLEHQTAAGLVAVELTEVEAYEGQTDPASHAYRGKTPRNAVMFGPPGHAYVYFTYGMHFCVNLVCGGQDSVSAVLLRAGAVIEGEDLARARRSSRRGGTAPDRGNADRGNADRGGTDRGGTDRGGTDRGGTDRGGTDRGGTDRGGTDRGGTDRGGTDRGNSGQAPLAFRDLARGPARLCQALGIDRSLDGADVCVPDSPLRLRAGPGARTTDRSANVLVQGDRPVSPAGTPRKIAVGPRVGVALAAEVPWRFWFDGDPTVSVYRAHVPRRRGPASRKLVTP